MQLKLRSFVLPASHSPVRQTSIIIINNFCHNRGELNKLMSQHFCISLLKMKMMWIITSGFYSDQMSNTTFSESILGKMVGQYRESCSTALSFFLLIYHTHTHTPLWYRSECTLSQVFSFWFVFGYFNLSCWIGQWSRQERRQKEQECHTGSGFFVFKPRVVWLTLSLQYYRMLLLPTNK